MGVSVIVPAYNSESTIEHCIKSILDLEIEVIDELIVVDDGSTDNTSQICRALENLYTKMKYFKKTNAGVSSARNYGISKSTGQYIMFVDSDDEIESDILEKFADYIGKYDLIVSGIALVTDVNKINVLHNGTYSNVDLINSYGDVIPELLINGPWAKVYSKNIIDKFNIRFRENMTLGEDTLFVFEYLKYAKKIKMVGDIGYIYYQDGNNSLMTKFRKDGYENAKYVYSELFDICSIINNGTIPSNVEHKYKHVLMFYLQKAIINRSKISNAQLNEIIKDYCNDEIVRKCIRRKKSKSLGWAVADFFVLVKWCKLLKMCLTLYLGK